MNRAYAVIVGALAIAAVLCIGILAVAPDTARLEIGVELAKAAIGLFPAVFFGVVVAELVKRRDDERALREKRLDARRAFRDRSITAYNQSKSVRRYLRGPASDRRWGRASPPRCSRRSISRCGG